MKRLMNMKETLMLKVLNILPVLMRLVEVRLQDLLLQQLLFYQKGVLLKE